MNDYRPIMLFRPLINCRRYMIERKGQPPIFRGQRCFADGIWEGGITTTRKRNKRDNTKRNLTVRTGGLV